jgi:SNF2 family DNA or RNA helicase
VMDAPSSLRIEFGDTTAKARLHAGPGSEHHLRQLALYFRSATQSWQGILDVDVDDLLTNLASLAAWPEPATVSWDPQLAGLARASAEDAQRVEQRLAQRDQMDWISDPASVAELLGSEWIGDLTEFQRRDIAHLLSLRHGANFSVPGAGKTRVGLAVFQALRRTEGLDRLLVVGPKSSYAAWLEEAEACLAKPLPVEIYGGSISPASEVVLINYERLDAAINELGTWLSANSSMLILDEAHRMKLGAGGVYGSACLALGPRAKHRLILTGTPAPNGVKDLENLFSFVWPGHGRQKVIQAVGGGDLVAASRALRPLFSRTTKKELGLPPVDLRLRLLSMPPLHQEIYDALLGQFSARAVDSADDFQTLGRIVMYMLMAATSPALLAVGATRHDPLEYRVPPLAAPPGTRLFDLMRDLPSYEMSPKYQEALAIVADNAAQGRKTLVWSTFIRSLNTLNGMLREFSPVMVHGGTVDRDVEIRRFREDPNCLVLLSNPATLGEGISLHHECHDAIYIDRSFAAGQFLQSLDRIHRLGLLPDTATHVTVLAARDTIDEVVEQRLRIKLEFLGTILDDPAVQELADLAEEPPVGGGLDQQDLQALMGHFRAHTT